MRAFEITSMYDFENQEWVELYHVDGEEVDAETYFEEMEYEVDGDEFEDECDGDCENCDKNEESDDSFDEEVRIISETIQRIFEVMPCPECVAEAVMELAHRFKEIGWENHKNYISLCNED